MSAILKLPSGPQHNNPQGLHTSAMPCSSICHGLTLALTHTFTLKHNAPLCRLRLFALPLRLKESRTSCAQLSILHAALRLPRLRTYSMQSRRKQRAARSELSSAS